MKLSAPIDTENPMHQIDGADARDRTPEPDDEELRAKKPKHRKRPVKQTNKKHKEITPT
jgi:hypothetical protein